MKRKIYKILNYLKITSIYKRLFKNNFIAAFKFYFYNTFISNVPSYKIRHVYLKKTLKIQLGKSTSIGMGCFFAGNQIIIGNNTVVNRKCYFDGRVAKIEIGNNVSISSGTNIITMSHDVKSQSFEAFNSEVKIEDFVWTGFNSIILPGVVLKEGCVLGAGSIATKSLDEYSVNVGCPAKKIGDRNHNLNYTLNYFPYFNSDICKN